MNRTFPALPELHDLVDSEDRGGYECIPSSRGLDLILRDVQGFLESLEAEQVSVEEFFAPHLKNFYLWQILQQPWLMQAMLGRTNDDSFIAKVFMASGDSGNYWLRVALTCGVQREQLASMILAKLQSSSDWRVSSTNFAVSDFLRHGFGEIEGRSGHRYIRSGDTYWSMLSDEQLIEAMQIVIDKAPNLLFSGHVNSRNQFLLLADMLDLRLGEAQVNMLLEAASYKLTSLSEVQSGAFSRLPMDCQIRAGNYFLKGNTAGGAVSFIVSMAQQMGMQNGASELLKEYQAELGTTQNALFTYKWFLGKTGLEEELKQALQKIFLEALERAGWHVGELVEGSHRGQRQLFVQVGSMRFVKERRQHDYAETRYYSPRAGDLVAFRRNEGYELVPGRVRAISFALITPAAS